MIPFQKVKHLFRSIPYLMIKHFLNCYSTFDYSTMLICRQYLQKYAAPGCCMYIFDKEYKIQQKSCISEDVVPD